MARQKKVAGIPQFPLYPMSAADAIHLGMDASDVEQALYEQRLAFSKALSAQLKQIPADQRSEISDKIMRTMIPIPRKITQILRDGGVNFQGAEEMARKILGY